MLPLSRRRHQAESGWQIETGLGLRNGRLVFSRSSCTGLPERRKELASILHFDNEMCREPLGHKDENLEMIYLLFDTEAVAFLADDFGDLLHLDMAILRTRVILQYDENFKTRNQLNA